MWAWRSAQRSLFCDTCHAQLRDATEDDVEKGGVHFCDRTCQQKHKPVKHRAKARKKVTR